jgi:hypothetical protein
MNPQSQELETVIPEGMQLMIAYEPFAFTSMDLIGLLPETANGNKYLLVWTDHHTRWVEAVPIKNKEALTVAKAFHEHVVCRFGAPFVVMSDRGKEFLNAVMSTSSARQDSTRVHTIQKLMDW